eukprot:1586720-Prymnesium_polylepis.1
MMKHWSTRTVCRCLRGPAACHSRIRLRTQPMLSVLSTHGRTRRPFRARHLCRRPSSCPSSRPRRSLTGQRIGNRGRWSTAARSRQLTSRTWSSSDWATPPISSTTGAPTL